jgi:hypothetical protein
VIPFEILDVAQVQIAKTKAPVSMVVGQFDQPICHLIVLSIALTLVAIAGLADSKCHTGYPDTNTSTCYLPLGHLSSARWPHHFFSRASETISALSFFSKYIFF